MTGQRILHLSIAIAGAALLSCASNALSAQDQTGTQPSTQTQTQQGTQPPESTPPTTEPQQGTQPPATTPPAAEPPANEPQQGTEGTEGTQGTTGQQTTLTGQLSKNDMGGYVLVEEQSGDTITLQGPEDLADHVGTKVSVTGKWATDADGNQYFEVSTVAPA